LKSIEIKIASCKELTKKNQPCNLSACCTEQPAQIECLNCLALTADTQVDELLFCPLFSPCIVVAFRFKLSALFLFVNVALGDIFKGFLLLPLFLNRS
jgi:hypothetical protein